MNVSNKVCNNILNCLSEVERVNNFCYLEDNMNSGGSELAVTRRLELEWKAFESMFSILCGKRHTCMLKGKFIGHV